MEHLIVPAVNKMYNELVHTLGSGEELYDECETGTCYTISVLYPFFSNIKKIEGHFEGKPHFWSELEGQIIDLTVEQFGYHFEFPVSKERQKLYHAVEIISVTDELLKDCQHISRISGLSLD